jgi:hypothetical protein
MNFLLLVATVMAQSCDQTNRLCIVDTHINRNSAVQVFYPTNLIPTDISGSSLSLSFFVSNGTLNGDPCTLTSLVKSYPIQPTRVNDWTNATTVTVDVPAGEYVMQLSDPEKRQCLLGPNIRGMYFESVQVREETTSSIAVASPTSTVSRPVVPDAEIPSSNSNNQRNLIIAVAVGISIVALVVIAMVLIRMRKRREVAQGKREDLPESDVEQPPSVHLALSRSRLSFGSKMSLKRYSTERASAEEMDDEPRPSMAIERPSGDSVDKVLNKL